MTSTESLTIVPVGSWQFDPVHSSVGFEIAYLGGTFKGQFREIEATLTASAAKLDLEGLAKVASVDVKDENLSVHLQSPDFFDAERFPELSFVTHDVSGGPDELSIAGELTIKGVTGPIEATGVASGPITDPYGRTRVGLTLTTSVDRTAFAVDWNAPLPSGEPALADNVTILAELFFVQAA